MSTIPPNGLSTPPNRSAAIPQRSPPPYHHQNQPPIGLTGVLCESHFLPLYNNHKSPEDNNNDKNKRDQGGNQSSPQQIRGNLHYTVYRPRYLSYKPPLVAVAGGPGMPCAYLLPLVHIIADRSVILYDQLGCGQSSSSSFNSSSSSESQASNGNSSSPLIDSMVDDLEALIQHVIPDGTNFHLLGHSFGGILVYEYLQRRRQQQEQQQKDSSPTMAAVPKRCLTATLVSTPTSVALCQASCDRLIQVIVKETSLTSSTTSSTSSGGDQDDDDDETNHGYRTAWNTHAEDGRSPCPPNGRMEGERDHDEPDEVIATLSLSYSSPSASSHLRRRHQELFSARHECRIQPIPLPLQQSYMMMMASAQSRARGWTSIHDYVAKEIESAGYDINESVDFDHSKESITWPPVLIIRGEYDFCTLECCEGWQTLFPQSQVVTLQDCSHYSMLEQEQAFGRVLSAFLQQHEPTPPPLLIGRLAPPVGNRCHPTPPPPPEKHLPPSR